MNNKLRNSTIQINLEIGNVLKILINSGIRYSKFQITEIPTRFDDFFLTIYFSHSLLKSYNRITKFNKETWIRKKKKKTRLFHSQCKIINNFSPKKI